MVVPDVLDISNKWAHILYGLENWNFILGSFLNKIKVYFSLSKGSTPTVGSSRISNLGSWSKAMDMLTLLFWPPLKVLIKDGVLQMRFVLMFIFVYLRVLISLFLGGRLRNSSRNCFRDSTWCFSMLCNMPKKLSVSSILNSLKSVISFREKKIRLNKKRK